MPLEFFVCDVQDVTSAADFLITQFLTSEALQRVSILASNLACASAIVEAVTHVVLIVGPNGGILVANRHAVRAFGYEAGELLGNPVEMLMPERSRSGHVALRKGFDNESEPRMMGMNRELWGRRKDGSLFPVEVGLSPLRFGEDNFVMVSMIDISARQQREFQARWCEAIVASSEDAIVSKTLDGIVTSWNKKAEEIFGYRADEIIGRSLVVLFPSDKFREEQQILERIHRGETVSHFRTRRMHKAGTPIDVSVTISPILNDANKIVGASKIVRDISSQVQTERQLQENATRLEAYRGRQEQENLLAREMLLKQMRLPTDDARVRCWLSPATTFSGDAITVAKSPSGCLYAMIADATGHGLASAITTLPLLNIFHSMAERDLSISAILAEANLFLVKNLPGDRFVCVSMLRVDFLAQHAQVWVGGMPDVFLLGGTGDCVQRFASTSQPLGIDEVPHSVLEPVTIPILPGQQFVLYSDGVTEARNSVGEEFGSGRLQALLADDPRGSILETLQAALRNHMGATLGHDDMSVLTVRC